MAIDSNRLQREVNCGTADPLLKECVDASKALLNRYITDVDEADEIPPVIFDQAHLAVAVDMFSRRKAPNGILMQQFDNIADGGAAPAPIRLSNDPLRAAYPVLAGWVSPVTFA